MHEVKPLPVDPNDWRCEDVSNWLKKIGMSKYADLIAFKHKVDGKCLLGLTDTDLKDPPVSINCLGDIKKILFAIGNLNKQTVECPGLHSKLTSNGKAFQNESLLVEYNESNHLSISGEDVVTTTRRSEIVQDEETLLDTLAKSTDGTSTVQLISREEIIRQVERPDTYFKSLAKLFIAFAYSSLSFLVTSFVMVLVHDRVPDTKTYPPLPDIVLDNVPHIPWAFDMCETIGLVLATVWFTVLFFHKERVIIARRMFSLLGTVFLLRCFTMLITSLSVPGIHLQCQARPNTTMQEKLSQAFHIWTNLGMSLHGVRSCGDYMFSGHTTVITMISHFITECKFSIESIGNIVFVADTPADWTGLHTFTWVLNCFAIFLILAAHEHYSIDVFIAFYISSRMFLYYHAYAYNHAGITATDYRMRTWFPLGWFFEYGSQGKVENEFSLPISIRIPRRVFFAKSEEPKQSPKPENSKKKSATPLKLNGNAKNHSKKHN